MSVPIELLVTDAEECANFKATNHKMKFKPMQNKSLILHFFM
jgi:hypothetical protein